MSKLLNISREDVLSAINRIDNDPSLLKGRQSYTYDILYENKTYPPILLISLANQIRGGDELTIRDFYNNTKLAFKVLKDLDFELVKKETSFYEQLTKFLEQSLTDNLQYASYQKQFVDLIVKVSFGQGGSAKIPWISFLREGQTTSDGIYPVYLYYKNEKLLILAYGVSETNQANNNWDIEYGITIEEYFVQNNLGKPFRYGKSFVYKYYHIENLPAKEIINEDLLNLLSFYKSLNLYPYSKKENLVLKEFEFIKFESALSSAKIFFSGLDFRLIASLLSKPFVILSGLSGSGKTKLAQAFVQWISADENQYRLIPVGADWTNREPLLGYPNGLEETKYVTPDSGALHLIIEASKPDNKNKPYFIILDEMNLSHVERYFADFLSIMESEDSIKLYSGSERKDSQGKPVPPTLKWPSNLYIIGTVNIDETTYMFSPKVLDRANVIEFRVTDTEMEEFLKNPTKPDLKTLEGQGRGMAESFLELSKPISTEKNPSINNELVEFFKQLKKVGAEFGYRSASEITQLIAKLKKLDENLQDNTCLDIAIMQKLLPKLHGSRSKLVKVLIGLASLCVEEKDFEKQFEDFYKKDFEGIKPKYPISFEKIIRMYKNVLANGFTSYAEA